MKRVLILCAHRPGRSPSQRYRFEQYLSYLEKENLSFTFSYLLDSKTDKIFYSKGKLLRKFMILFRGILTRLQDVKRFKDFDFIFIQREAYFLGTSYFESRAYHSGAKVIFDFDDSIWLSDTSPGNKKWEWMKKPQKFLKNVQFAHTVVAGNKYLAEKSKPINSNTIIIPTTIDTDFHLPKPELRNRETVVIGWSGSLSTIKHFESIKKVLLAIQKKYEGKIHYKIIADRAYDHGELKVECVTWTEATEVDELNTFDIGIMPLPDDEWAKGKCGLKGLSYMACGLATILSSVGTNKEIIENHKNGILVSTEKEWFDALSLLIENKTLRAQFGIEGRKTVIEKYSVIANKEKYRKLFLGD